MATTKYFVLPSSPGANFTDFDLSYGTVRLNGEQISFVGSSAVDAVFVRPGVSVDFTLSGSGADKIYLGGNFASYTASITGSVMTLQRGSGVTLESVSFIKSTSAASSDSVIFADGTLNSLDLYNNLKTAVALPALSIAETSLAPLEQKDIDESGMYWVDIFSKRSPERAEILRGATFRTADEIFEREKTVDLGGVRVRMLYVGPAHTLGDTAFYIEEDRVLFPGDLAMKEIFPAFAMPQSSMRAWLTSLEMLERLKPAHVIGSHGDLADGSILSANHELLSTLQTRTLELKREGKTAEATGKLLVEEFKTKYPAWDQPVRVISAVDAIYKETP